MVFFFCITWPALLPPDRVVFIGYPYGKKGWELFDLETKEIFVSRDVEFVETKYLFSIDVTTKKYVPPKNWTCKEIVDDVIDGVEEMDHRRGTEESGDMPMDDRRGEQDAGYDEQCVTLQNMDTRYSVSIYITNRVIIGYRTYNQTTFYSIARLCNKYHQKIESIQLFSLSKGRLKCTLSNS